MRVLFLGNSYTLYHNVPKLTQTFARSAGKDLECDMIAQGGAYLKLHYEELGTPEKIRSSAYDAVVIQGNSNEPILAKQRFHEYADKFVDLVHEANAKPFLYQTWARHKHHEMYRNIWWKIGFTPAGMLKRIRREYAAVAARKRATVIPCGEAWAHATKKHRLMLHDADLHHAALAGAALSAMVAAAKLTGSSTDAMNHRPTGLTETQCQLLKLSANSALNSL